MLLRLLMVFVMALTVGSSVQATEDDISQKKLDELRKRINEKKSEINGSQWEVVLGSLDPKIKGQKDTLLFQNDQVTSAGMSKRGFGPTNYTVSVPQEEGSEGGIWETMKTGKDGVIFMRGEWENDNMRGDVTEQLDGGKEFHEYIFTTSSRMAVSPTSSEGSVQAPLQSGMTDPDIAGNDGSGSGALVSKETSSKSITSFTPGTTDEISKTSKKR